jgi:nucleoside triphosphate pyrophosphatase
MSMPGGPPLVLASASEARAQILRKAGIFFVRDPATVDEASVKAAQRAQGAAPEQAAVSLAEAKALEVAGRHPGSFVIGADQLLVCGSRWFDKPETRTAARATLEALRGQTHRLISGIVVARDRTVRWRHVEVARLTMRRYSDHFIDWYLREAEESSLHVVGACRLEGVGAQALHSIDGDYFAILGLPLLPLLEFLRREGVVLA